jgi:hypothetical protein
MTEPQAFVRELGGKARRRAVASIMGYSETVFSELVEEADWQRYREKVLNALGVYHDTMTDIMLTLGEGPGIVNEHALEMLERIHGEQTRLRRAALDNDSRALNGRLIAPDA